jgi:hypothetical protein
LTTHKVPTQLPADIGVDGLFDLAVVKLLARECLTLQLYSIFMKNFIGFGDA